jgi:hypothetical protein
MTAGCVTGGPAALRALTQRQASARWRACTGTTTGELLHHVHCIFCTNVCRFSSSIYTTVHSIALLSAQLVLLSSALVDLSRVSTLHAASYRMDITMAMTASSLLPIASCTCCSYGAPGKIAQGRPAMMPNWEKDAAAGAPVHSAVHDPCCCCEPHVHLQSQCPHVMAIRQLYTVLCKWGAQ